MSEIIKKLKEFDLGLRRGTLSLSPFSAKWAQGFEFVEQFLRSAISEVEIRHVGSTAIDGCDGKPILDLVIWHNSRSKFYQETQNLIKIGFTVKGEYGVPGRCFFNFYDSEENDYIHLHAFQRGHPAGIRMQKFVEKLSNSQHLIADYNQHKKNLVRAGISRKNYPGAKTGFIEKVVREL